MCTVRHQLCYSETPIDPILSRALKLHPSCIALYVLAAQQELDSGSPSAARILLQRGIRLNSESTEIWVEYVTMELNFVETLRRRWKTLGIKEESVDMDEQHDLEVPEDEAARQAILNGAIVKQVMEDAVKGEPQIYQPTNHCLLIYMSALPRLKTFTSLLDLLRTYPTPLAPSLIQHAYDLMRLHLPSNAEARVLYADRHLNSTLHPDLKGALLVDAIRESNEELTRTLQESGELVGMPEAYSEWIVERFRTAQEPHLVSDHPKRCIHSLTVSLRNSILSRVYTIYALDCSSLRRASSPHLSPPSSPPICNCFHLLIILHRPRTHQRS